MKKRKEHAFGINVYLLGKDKQTEEYLWLEEPIWDCGWYWGFGYVEKYTNHKSPQNSNDITMHTHWNIIHKDNKNPFSETTFTNKEYVELKELFNKFYRLRNEAETYHYNGLSADLYNDINENAIPEITNRIIQILTP